ncbi:CFI-box-CTERM domain-containing protein [Nitrosopumilus sp. b2]|uniref:CFI-box-CTERM domain-containing protein n=1 Tax=Nitrosopumilus sp. b2 TaxID=2109908 RepID=UPI0015F43550|nr:CFI-box-CTERM domain-containing protein [Nitrosopumilus sp. b2]KAF6245002.1 hypothetical protein C6989_05500 [Nitrosopumilus sp. b2]
MVAKSNAVSLFLIGLVIIMIQPHIVYGDEKQELDRCIDRMDYCDSRCISGIVCQYDQCIQDYGCEEAYVKELKEKTGMIDEQKNQGGCLIATAAHGTELSIQVQQLRELRDNKLMQTDVGTSFMDSFNAVYYSFSPTISDYQRENPIFKEMVKTVLIPLLTTLSILNGVEMDSEEKVLIYGVGIIIVNIGIYFIIPPTLIWKIIKINKTKRLITVKS